MGHDHIARGIKGHSQRSRLGFKLGFGSKFEMLSVGPRSSIEDSFLMMMMMMMMTMRRFVERVLNRPQTRCQSQSNRWDLRCRANARGESVAVRRAAGRLFQMCGPATAKLLIPSVVVVLGTNSVPVSADRRCNGTHRCANYTPAVV